MIHFKNHVYWKHGNYAEHLYCENELFHFNFIYLLFDDVKLYWLLKPERTVCCQKRTIIKDRISSMIYRIQTLLLNI